MPRPDDPRYLAELALGRLLWLAIPEHRRRSLLLEAAELLGTLAPIPGWAEQRAWELAGIHRHRLRQLVLDEHHARALLGSVGHLLAEGPQDAPGAAIGARAG